MCGVAEPQRDVFHSTDISEGQWVFTVKYIYKPDYPVPDYLIDEEYFHECDTDFILWDTKHLNSCPGTIPMLMRVKHWKFHWLKVTCMLKKFQPVFQRKCLEF